MSWAWLVRVEVAGESRAWSTGARPAGVLAATVRGLDEVGIAEELSAPGEPQDAREVSISLVWPEAAELEAAGWDLASGSGEVWLVPDGDWTARRRLLAGRLRGVEVGEEGEPVSVTIAEDAWDDRHRLPAGMLVDASTWSAAPEVSEGRPYPLVLGTPGAYQRPDGSTAYASAAPALAIGSGVLLLSVGRVAGAEATIYSEADDDSESFPVTYALDGENRLVAVADISSASTITPADDGVYWSIVEGVTDRDSARRTGGEMLAWALRQSSLRLDAGALRAAEAMLGGYLLGGYLDVEVSPLQWVVDNLLPILPVSLIGGAAGLAPVIWRWWATAADAEDHLRVGCEGIVRDGRLVRADDEICNEVSLSYALRARTGAYLRRRTISGDPRRAGEPDVISSQIARRSYAAYGARVADPLTSDLIYDTATADRVLIDRVALRGISRREVALTAPLARLVWLRPGAILLLTDSSVALAGAVAIVRRVEFSIDVARIHLWLL